MIVFIHFRKKKLFLQSGLLDKKPNVQIFAQREKASRYMENRNTDVCQPLIAPIGDELTVHHRENQQIRLKCKHQSLPILYQCLCLVKCGKCV